MLVLLWHFVMKDAFLLTSCSFRVPRIDVVQIILAPEVLVPFPRNHEALFFHQSNKGLVLDVDVGMDALDSHIFPSKV